MAELIPLIGKMIYPNRVWHRSREEKVIYLTFDDGPIPLVTPWVLKLLDQFQAKATFFCIGENIQKHPEVFKSIIENKHRVGNHTLHHVNGWKTNSKDYLQQIFHTQEIIKNHHSNSAKALFRPPYGKATSQQTKVTLNPGDYVRIIGQTISSTGTSRNSIRIYSVSLTLD